MLLPKSYPLSLFQTLFIPFLSYTLYYIYYEVTTGASRRRFAASKGCKDPYVWRNWDPILGLDWLWMSLNALKNHTALEIMQKRYQKAGVSTASLQILRTNIIATIEPENLKSVLATDFKSFSLSTQRKKLMIPIFGEGIFTTDGPAWQHSRNLLRPNFVRAQFGDIEMFERHVQNVITRMPRDGKTMVQLHDVFSRLSLDVSTEFLFGKSVGSLRSEGVGGEDFVRAFEYAGGSVEGVEGKWGILGPFLPDPRFKKEVKVMQDYVDNIIEKASENHAQYEVEKEKGGRYVFLHELLSQMEDKIKIRSELLNILLAGRDTTAAVLSNVWFELSRRPAVWESLRAEVNSLEGNHPDFSQLKSLRYLRALINESLRLYPVVPENERQATQDTVLPLGGGPDGKSPVFVPEGTHVHWSLWTMHRRKDIWGSDAEEFRPERWIDGEGMGFERKGRAVRVGWEWLPFNGGARICIGQQFALTEISYVTVRLMQEFSGIESRDSEPWREKFTMICYGLGGCKVVLHPKA